MGLGCGWARNSVGVWEVEVGLRTGIARYRVGVGTFRRVFMLQPRLLTSPKNKYHIASGHGQVWVVRLGRSFVVVWQVSGWVGFQIETNAILLVVMDPL